MVACHRKLRTLLFDQEVDQFLLLGELVTESDTLVVHTEADHDGAVRGWLLQGGCQFIVVVTDVLGLAPYGLPGLVKRGRLLLGDLETVHQVGLLHALRGVLVLGQFETQVRGLHHRPSFVGHLIDGTARVIH